MSKASDYAERVKAARETPEKFIWKDGDQTTAAYVTENGHFAMHGPAISQAGAWALADWIHRTFGYKAEVAREEKTFL